MDSQIEILSNIIKRRRSIFPVSYTSQEIPVEVIEKILESANYAPTHKMTQPWRFIVYRKEGKTKLGLELARIYKEATAPEKFLQKKYDSIAEKFDQSSCVLAINAQLHPEKLPAWEEVAALACAVQNMSLTAEALNVGAYWSSPDTISELGAFMELKENEQCFGLFYMGYHEEEERTAVRTPMSEKVKWVEE
ncbi:nitroreductase [Pedobacter sp. MC2016-14]|uniref:nitroreductase family protein n=1 Tax=Pedobacter sp. MC2016-14 TaxID=2897327 RepID=UPI001E39E48A|nr:nitroreductase [Pedobacter sp. MC2016-14]MCD0489427.1 nitroreductase [Pedobacter sp. MC2016-14]